MNRIILSVFFCSIFHVAGYSQNDRINEYTTTSYKNALTYGFTLHSNGLGLGFQYFNNHTFNRNIICNFDILTLKHPKETKVINPMYDNARPYVFGKKNSVILLRPGFGNQFIIADKENQTGIRINYNFVIGADIAMLKPVYLNIIYIDDNGYETFRSEKYNPDNVIHNDQNRIKGSASWFEGFGSLDFNYGLFLKTSMSFEWNEYEENFKTLEIGGMCELFPEPLPVFAFISNKNVFINVFANLSLGRRW